MADQVQAPDKAAVIAALQERFPGSVKPDDRKGYEGIIGEFDLPMHVAQIGAKGCAMFRYERARNYRAWWDIDMDVSYAYWLFLANRGILFPPGFDDQWTISIQHTQADIDHHLHVFQQFVNELTR